MCLICSFELPLHSVDCWPLKRGKLITYLFAKQNTCKSVGKTAESKDRDAVDSSVFYLQVLSRKIIQHNVYKCKKNNRKRKYIHVLFLCVITLSYSSQIYNYVLFTFIVIQSSRQTSRMNYLIRIDNWRLNYFYPGREIGSSGRYTSLPYKLYIATLKMKTVIYKQIGEWRFFRS